MIFLLALLFPSLLVAQTPTEPRISTQKIILHTNLGNMTLGLFPDIAPQHVEQILRLAIGGSYDGTAIVRIEPGFVAQIENFNGRKVPLPEEIQKTIKKLPAEFSTIPHVRGILSMARFDDVNSAESSFSFLLGKAPHLDHNYTVFGKILDGMDTLAKIEQTPTTPDHHPITEVKIVSAEVIGEPDAPKTMVLPHATWFFYALMIIIIGSGLVRTFLSKEN